MKILNLRLAFLALAIALGFGLKAQSLNDVLSKVSSAVKSNSTVSSVIDNLIGTTDVSASSLVGTWNYSQPAVAFESDNALSKIGGAAASSKIETKVGTLLSKGGIQPGNFSITFNKDGSFSTVVKGKTVSGVYSVSGSTITLAKSSTAKTKITGNVKLSTTLQITFKADKLLQFAQQFGQIAAKANTQLSTLSTLAKSYNGMQLGMRFSK